MTYAPDIDNPFPKPNGNGGKGGNNGGGAKSGFMPGEIKSLAQDMVASNGGTREKWTKYLRSVYSPVKPQKYNYGGGNGGKGGGKVDPTKPGTGPNGTGGDTGGVVPTSPNHRMGPVASQYGVLAGMQPGQGVMSGIPMMPQQQQMAAPQVQMPNEGVLAMLRARMGR